MRVQQPVRDRNLSLWQSEEVQNGDPYAINYLAAGAGMNPARLGISQYADPTKFYNHTFAIFDIKPDALNVSYYEYPSWGLANPNAPNENNLPPIGNPLLTEVINPAAHGP